MRKLTWKIQTERSEHLFFFAMMPIFLGALLTYMRIESLQEYLNMVTTALGVICCWMLIWACSRPNSMLKLPKKLLNLWIWLNTVMSAAVIVLTIGMIFFGW